MNEFSAEGVWFIYDGECPICNQAAQALRIKEKYGALHLLNAREEKGHPLLQTITQKEFDLDEGMVIYTDGRFYHGKDALKFMARHGETKNPFMAFCKSLFWSDGLAKFLYPPMRAVRNWLINRKGAGRIDNLQLKEQPIFQSIFGDSWQALPPVMHKHYRNRPYTNDKYLVRGRLDVMCKPPLTWLAPLMRLMGQIPTRNAQNVQTTVEFQSEIKSKAFHFYRKFYFTADKPYIFHSKMLPLNDGEVVELMAFGLGWKSKYSWDGEKVILAHRGYVLRLFGWLMPLPLHWFMGKGYAEERAIDDNHFEMETHIRHPWWGKVYEYKGKFEVVD
ncbi:DUF4166 domain-containing protein [bacterium SCSIO 12696]|nr:DUF4166 domain-containing protein [bacterium SCSIO 12696]